MQYSLILHSSFFISMTIDEYILQHIDDEGDYLKALYRDTHLKLLYPRMASGHLQGRMLKMFVKMIRPHRILEIGTYSGYSALCLAEGLPEDGMLYTFEINDEQEDFTRPWLEHPRNNDLQTIGIKAFNEHVAHDTRVEKVILPLRDGLTIIHKK